MRLDKKNIDTLRASLEVMKANIDLAAPHDAPAAEGRLHDAWRTFGRSAWGYRFGAGRVLAAAWEAKAAFVVVFVCGLGVGTMIGAMVSERNSYQRLSERIEAMPCVPSSVQVDGWTRLPSGLWYTFDAEHMVGVYASDSFGRPNTSSFFVVTP